MTKSVVALFDDFPTANGAVRELMDRGFPRDDISLMANDASGEYSRTLNQNKQAESSDAAGVGAGVGAAIGGVGGLLVGLGALGIPVIGPVIAAGPLAAALSALVGAGAGAVVGGVTGGLVGALVDVGIPKDTAQYYLEGVRRGGTLVILRSQDEMYQQAVDILNRHHPVNLQERSAQWRESGWQGFGTDTEQNMGMSSQTNRGDVYDPGSTSMGHDMNRDLRDYPTGTESGQDLHTGLQDENLRNPAHDPTMGGQEWNKNAKDYYAGSDTEMNTRTDSQNVDWHQQTHDTEAMNRQDMTGSSMNTDNPNMNRMRDLGTESTNIDRGTDIGDSGDFYTHEDRFRNHFANSMYATEFPYDQFQPAYYYGYELARDPNSTAHDWNEVEYNAQENWERQHPGTWERVKDAVQYAWEQFKNRFQ